MIRLEAVYEEGHDQVRHSWDTPQCVIWCRLAQVPASVTRSVKKGGGNVVLGCNVTGAKRLHILTNVTASLVEQPWSGVFLGRMSVFLRSTLDVGEVKRGEGGGQPLSSWHTPFLSFSLTLFSSSHIPLAPVEIRHARDDTPAPPCASSAKLSLSLSLSLKSTVPTKK
jgi:hypothetical protein